MIPHDSHDDQGQSRLWIRWGAYSALFLLFWISLLKFPDYVFHIGPDESYEQALGFFLRNRMQAGVDYIFTYGPLGYFYSRAYHPDLYWYKYSWEVFIKAVLALVSVAVFARQPGALVKSLFVLVFSVYLLADPQGIDDFLFPFLILSICLLLFTQQMPRILEWPTLSVLAALALVKFTFCLLAIVYLSILIVYRLCLRSYVAAVGAAGFFTISLLGIWVGSGQQFANLPTYFYTSLELTRGHTEAMSLPGDPWHVARALGMVALILALVPILDLRGLPKSRLLALGPVFAAGLFFQWKYGFIRPDHHAVAFICYALSIPFLLFLAFPVSASRRGVRFIAIIGCMILGVPAMMVPKGQTMDIDSHLQAYGSHWAANLGHLLFPQRLKSSLDATRQALFPSNKSLLPLIHAKIDEAKRKGEASVDFLHSRLGWVFMQGFTWRPRPVFQSYATYTRFLLEANAAFYRSERAPDYVLVFWQPIDNRFPTLEDSQVLFEILNRYEPVIFEKGFVLLKRTDRQAESPGAVVREGTISFDQSVELGDTTGLSHTISFRLKPTFWGRLRSFLFKPPQIYMQVTTTDAKTASYRFIPSMAEEEFLLDPLVRDGKDLLRLYADAVSARITSFRITVSETGPASYENEMQIRIRTRSKLVGRSVALQKINELFPAED
jgi:hypothetical protein